MRPSHFLLSLALAICSISASAADVDFEFGLELFELNREASQPNPFRITIVPEKPSFDHPIYEGLWPMTLEAFAPNDNLLRPTPFALPNSSPSLVPQPIEEPWQAVGQKIVCTGKCDCRSGYIASVEFSFVPNYDSPLFEGLWPMTLEMFRTADEENFDESVPGMVIAANDMQPLRDSLWKSTREKFAEMDAIYIFGGIAFNR